MRCYLKTKTKTQTKTPNHMTAKISRSRNQNPVASKKLSPEWSSRMTHSSPFPANAWVNHHPVFTMKSVITHSWLPFKDAFKNILQNKIPAESFMSTYVGVFYAGTKEKFQSIFNINLPCLKVYLLIIKIIKLWKNNWISQHAYWDHFRKI